MKIEDLNPDTLKQLGLKPPRKPRAFNAEDERRFALRALAGMADLTQAQRGRVLRRAQRINDV